VCERAVKNGDAHILRAREGNSWRERATDDRKRAQVNAVKTATLDDATTLAEKGTMLMSRGNYNDALVIYDKCLSIQLQVEPLDPRP